MMTHRNVGVLMITAIFLCQCSGKKEKTPDESLFRLSRAALKDKIRGGWAGQVIGCSYGGPTEFKFKGSMIQEYQPIVWYDDYIKDTFESDPGLYDDVYMDLTFVEVLEKAGLLRRRRYGRVHEMQLEAKLLKAAAQWVEEYRKFWEGSLDRLAAYLEKSTESSHEKGAK